MSSVPETGSCICNQSNLCSTFLQQLVISTIQSQHGWTYRTNLFDVNCPELRSLSTSLAATKEDNINCDEAEIVGEAIQTKLSGAEILSCTIQCKDQIRTLSCLEDAVKIGNETVYVKPEVLFNRLALLVQKMMRGSQFFNTK